MGVHDHLSCGSSIRKMEIEGFVFKFAFEGNTDAAADTEHSSGSCLRDRCAGFMVFFGNDQRVSEVDRTDIQKCQDQFIFINFSSRNFTGDDFAENTLTHF